LGLLLRASFLVLAGSRYVGASSALNLINDPGGTGNSRAWFFRVDCTASQQARRVHEKRPIGHGQGTADWAISLKLAGAPVSSGEVTGQRTSEFARFRLFDA